ncbi:hypothetical protein [Dactylosporangium sp. NPDC051541]|uniref:hypothetical protein n=1 Tax=Dactylosporangium sp. NPDC051541 TaxID=3363977 RepID=UPI0037A02EB4
MTSDTNRFRLHSGVRGGQESVLVHNPDAAAAKVREASQGRTRLLSIEDAKHGGTTLVWQGDFHEVSTFVHGIDVPLQTLPSMVAGLDLQDSRDGMVVRARPGSGVRVDYVMGGNFIPAIASVTVKPLESATEQVPRSGGKAVKGGRTWRDDEIADDGTVLRRRVVLANGSTASFLDALEPTGRDLVPLLETISFTLS